MSPAFSSPLRLRLPHAAEQKSTTSPYSSVKSTRVYCHCPSPCATGQLGSLHSWRRAVTWRIESIFCSVLSFWLTVRTLLPLADSRLSGAGSFVGCHAVTLRLLAGRYSTMAQPGAKEMSVSHARNHCSSDGYALTSGTGDSVGQEARVATNRYDGPLHRGVGERATRAESTQQALPVPARPPRPNTLQDQPRPSTRRPFPCPPLDRPT
ncbi:hypothetical protein BKA80DRAFT_31581 [Phyllosticta citrichinensis]